MSPWDNKTEVRELRHIAKRVWPKMFGKQMLLGYPVNPTFLPMLRRCIEKEDSSEFYTYLSELNKERKEQGQVW